MKGKRSLLTEQLSPLRKSLMLLAVLSFGLGAAIVSQAVVFAVVIDRIFWQGASLTQVTILLGALLAIIAGRTALSYGNGRIGLHMAAKAKTALRQAVLRKLTRDLVPTALRGQVGAKVSVALDAVDEADSYFSQYMPRMAEMALVPVIILAAVFTQHWPSGLIMLVTAPFIPLFMVLVGLKTKQKSEEKYAQLAEFSGTFLDSLQGLVTLKLFARVHRQQAEIERSSLAFRDATMGILRIAFTNTFMLELVVMLSIGLVALELALQMIVYQSVSFVTAFVILLLVPEFYNVLKNAGTAFHSGRTSIGAVRKVQDLLEETAGVQENTVQITDRLRVQEEPPRIEWRNIRFEYAPDGFQLDCGSFSIAPRQQIAIVGKSGSGKTTLLHLIAGLLQPSSGEMLVEGRPLAQLDESSWFSRVSYITQHPYIFAGTIADNIAIDAGRDVSRSSVEQAADAAGLAGMIAELEQGYDTVVGEGGRGLSGGEKQRLALARAFLKRPAVILFDEPTVGLDLHTERILQQSISRLAREATMITVAHRLHTIRDADSILFLEDGVLLGSGSHDDLAASLPQYAQMVNIQQGGEAE